MTFFSDDYSNSFGHGGCQTFELLHLDAGPGVGDKSFQFYKAGRMATSHASLPNVPDLSRLGSPNQSSSITKFDAQLGLVAKKDF